MRIVLVHKDIHASVNRGGICRIYTSLALQFIAKKHDLYLISGETLPQDLIIGGKQICITGARTHAEYLGQVRDLVREIAPDICECSTWEYELLYYSRLKRSRRIPIIVRGDLTASSLGINHMIEGERELLHNCDGVICVSKYAQKDLYQAYGVTKSYVIGNAVDVSRFRAYGLDQAIRLVSGEIVVLDHAGAVITRHRIVEHAKEFSTFVSSRTCPIVLWCGKITEMKGWDNFEAIVHKLYKKVKFIVLLGHSKAYYPITINSLPNVMILQNISNEDLPKIYSLADYCLSTSRWEGFGLTILEAMACGKTVLLPESLEVWPELIKPGITGLLYRTVSDIDTYISRGIKTIPSIAPEYSWEYNYSRTLQVYESVLEQRGMVPKENVND